MVKSMTGYGKNVVSSAETQISVEIKSVNNKYVSVRSDIPGVLSEYEHEFEKMIKDKLKRGSIHLTINIERKNDDAGVEFNKDKMEAFYSNLKESADSFASEVKFNMSDILEFSDYFIEEKDIEVEKIISDLKEAINKSLDDVDRMRRKEGENMVEGINIFLDNIDNDLEEVEERSDKLKDQIFEKYKTKIDELLEESDADEDRIVQESAIYAKKMDITEECDRAKSHIQQFKEYTNKDGPIGKKMKFLTQELHRELNTIGAKANDSDISHLIVETKNELEKIKEQVRNIL